MTNSFITEFFSLILAVFTLLPYKTETTSPWSTVLVVKLGLSEDGAVTSEWIEAIRRRHDEESLSALLTSKKPISEEEMEWESLIKQRALSWPELVDSLRIPFKTTTPPDTVSVLLGNQGGTDAFVNGEVTMCFSLNELNRLYGSATEAANSNRIDRFFCHEFTHLLHKAWRNEHDLQLESPLDYALWECLTEGLGNYRSLSGRWLAGKGELSAHAREVLGRLQPIFVERLAALEHATDEDADLLLEGLSMGPFEQKWGALTVALWLAQEAGGDDRNLQKWVDAGPPGILILAQKYLPEELKEQLPKTSGH